MCGTLACRLFWAARHAQWGTGQTLDGTAADPCPSTPAPTCPCQAIGATTPAFTALLGYMIGHQRESRTVYLSLVPVVVGVVIASGAEVRTWCPWLLGRGNTAAGCVGVPLSSTEEGAQGHLQAQEGVSM